MIRKLLFITSALVFFTGNSFSQNTSSIPLNKISGTEAPPQQWDDWFNARVEEYIKNNPAAKSASFPAYTIPVIFHILHSGQATGTSPNITQARVGVQVNILNQIYNGQGANPNAIAQYSNYAANPNIQFCLATADPTNIPLAEPGINRIDMAAVLGANTNTMQTDAQVLAFIEYTAKPYAIWDPTKYLNIFVSPTSSSVTVLGRATFPASTTLQGSFGSIGTGTTDGVWVSTQVVGTASATPGPYIANYDKGKTLAMEIGHWLGVRNIWGDANCGSDYCNDTPPHTGPNSACPGSYPYKVNSCGPNLSPGGEMSMNMMDNTYDDCRWMFTNDQVIRMHTAMSQCPYRWLLGTHGLCSPTIICSPTVAAQAAFSLTAPAPCFGMAFTPVNFSSGCPAPTFTWNLTPNTATVTQGYYTGQPSFNLSNQGTYTLELIAANSAGTTSQTVVFTTSVCPLTPLCLDTLKKIKKTDTLAVYAVPGSTSVIGCNGPSAPGFLTGTNCYNDKEFAQYFAANSYSNIPIPQLGSVYVLFNRAGTVSKSGSGTTNCNVWGGGIQNGPVTLLTQKFGALASVVATVIPTWSTVASPTNTIPWCGTSTYTFAGKDVYAYKYSFDPPYMLPTNGFFVGVEMPWTTKSLGDSAQIFGNKLLNASIADTSAFVRSFNGVWNKLNNIYGKNVQLAILPEVSCRNKVGVQEFKNELEINLKLMPNPNNGQFSILATLSKEQDLTFKIYNYVGQLLGTNVERGVTARVFDIDMSSSANGVYFIEISNGTQKTVRKMIISK
jgi:hypothetical protein